MENNSTENRKNPGKGSEVRPLDSVWVYALMGWLIGTFPLLLMLALDCYIEIYIHKSSGEAVKSGVVYYLIITGVCSVVGTMMGGFVGLLMSWARQKDRMLPIGLSPLLGLMWAIVTGGIGGIPAFILVFFVGIIIGAGIAAPFGITGFTLFSAIYEFSAARRQVAWWQTVLMAIGVLSLLLLGVFVWVKSNNPYF